MNPKEETEKAEWRKKMFHTVKAQLDANPVLQKMLERAHPNQIVQFVEDYAHEKVRWIDRGDEDQNWVEHEELKWLERANKCLDQILQKKLFDAHCLWRAEQLHTPEVKVTFDFRKWERDIRNCLFIEPITEQDVSLYMQYLNDNNFEEELGFLEGWQDYEDITEAYQTEESDRSVPEWYDFHNGRTGLGVYMTLPDIRGEKERFYMDLWRQQQLEERQKLEKQVAEDVKNGIVSDATDTRPTFAYYQPEWEKWFVTTFEDKKTIKKYKSYTKGRKENYFDENLEEALDILAMADRPVPIEGWFDWKEAVYRSAQGYIRTRIAEAMYEAYDQYRLNVDLGIGFAVTERLVLNDDWYRKAILIGRERNGEPRNFDF
jgi:hypothetical protein